MTDERMGDGLWSALDALPRKGGVVFRHYGLNDADRRQLFMQVARVARRRGLVLILAGPVRLGRGAVGRHGRSPHRSPGLRTWPAHNAREVIAGIRMGADAIFISPVFPTSSHPGGRALGTRGAARLARLGAFKAIAMGGLDATRFAAVKQAGFYGWAAIDAWTKPTRQATDGRKQDDII